MIDNRHHQSVTKYVNDRLCKLIVKGVCVRQTIAWPDADTYATLSSK